MKPLWKQKHIPLWKRIVLRSMEKTGQYAYTPDSNLPYLYYSTETLEMWLSRKAPEGPFQRGT